MQHRFRAGRALALPAIAALSLAAASAAWAHAHVSPPVALADETQVFSVIVPNEEEDADTTQVELSPGEGFSIGSIVPAPGWTITVDKTGEGEDAVVRKITWSGGKVPPDQAAVLQFLGRATSTGTVDFDVRQTYSNDKVVDWSGPESSDTPSPTIEATSSLGGGGGTSTLDVVALVVAGVALVLAAVALAARRGGRDLA